MFKLISEAKRHAKAVSLENKGHVVYVNGYQDMDEHGRELEPVYCVEMDGIYAVVKYLNGKRA